MTNFGTTYMLGFALFFLVIAYRWKAHGTFFKWSSDHKQVLANIASKGKWEISSQARYTIDGPVKMYLKPKLKVCLIYTAMAKN